MRLQTKGLAAAIAAGIMLSVLTAPQARAWGNTGHEAVAYVAWQQMNPTAQRQALALLQTVPQVTSPSGKKVDGWAQWVSELPAGLSADQKNLYLFMRAATWADSIKHVGFSDSDEAPANTAVDRPVGFDDSKSRGYWHFVDAGFTSDSSKFPAATPTPNAAVQIAELRKDLASSDAPLLKAYELVWLEHLVGDVHQPLHGVRRFVGGASDLGGNNVKILLPAGLKKAFEASLPPGARLSYPTELHAFWDDLPGELNAAAAPAVAASFGKSLPQADPADIQESDPATWAAKSFAVAQQDGYADPIGPGLTDAQGRKYVMTQAYYDTALADAKSQIALAGARLARLLNDTWPEANAKLPGSQKAR